MCVFSNISATCSMCLFEYNLTHSYINSTYILFHSSMTETFLIIHFFGLTGCSQVLRPDLLKFQQFS